VSPPNPNIKVVYRDSSRHSSGGKQRGAGHYACVTGSDITGSGPDRNEVTWPEVTSLPELCSVHVRKCIPAFFFTIVVVQNVPLPMTESSMATGCDVTESDVTGSDVIRSKVGDSPWGVILIVRCCIVLQGCFLSRLRSHCGISTKLPKSRWPRSIRRRRRWLRDIHLRCWQRDICCRRRSCSNTYRVMKKNPIIFWKPIIRFFLGSRRIRSRSFHAMGISVYQYDCRTYRQWKIDVCPTVRSQHQIHDDSQARPDLMVLWWISDVVWNRRRDIISTRFIGSG
jgi:hypothetical protein